MQKHNLSERYVYLYKFGWRVTPSMLQCCVTLRVVSGNFYFVGNSSVKNWIDEIVPFESLFKHFISQCCIALCISPHLKWEAVQNIENGRKLDGYLPTYFLLKPRLAKDPGREVYLFHGRKPGWLFTLFRTYNNIWTKTIHQ